MYILCGRKKTNKLLVHSCRSVSQLPTHSLMSGQPRNRPVGMNLWFICLFPPTIYICIYIYRKSLLQTCRALYDCPSWKNSASTTPQRIYRFHHKMTIDSDLSKKPSNFSAECVGKLTSSSTLAQSATLRIHTALNQPRTHLRSKS